MNAELTLKNIDDEVLKRLQAEAKKRGIDLNTFVLRIFKGIVGLDTGKESEGVYYDLDYLAGTWTEEEAQAFAKASEDFNKIDKELWQ